MRLTAIIVPSGRPPEEAWLAGLRVTLGPDVRLLVPGGGDSSGGDFPGRAVVSQIPRLEGSHALVVRSGDDIHPAGLRECLGLLADDRGGSVIILGTMALRETPETWSGIIREMMAFGGSLSVDHFLLGDIDRPFTAPLSGIIIPVALLRRAEPFLRRHAASPWFPAMLLTLPGTERILQPPGPLVTTSLPRTPESALGADGVARAEYFLTQTTCSVDVLVADRLMGEAAALLARGAGVGRLVRGGGVIARSACHQGPGVAARVAWRVLRELGARGGLRLPGGGL